jgi:hypothetical protein
MWREFQPFLTVVTDFIQRGEQRSLPALLGAGELSKSQALVEKDDSIEFRNIRVAGPVPYEGDNVNLLVALFRTETANWLARTLDAVGSIATAVGASSLIAAKPVADSIVSSFTQFLDEKSLELRCGQYRGWSRAEDGENPGPSDLKPMHYVVMRRPMGEGGADPAAGFTVSEGRLHAVVDGVAKPYTGHDFVLLGIEAKRTRDDYKKLDFYKFWEATKERLASGESDSAEREWRKTLGAIYTDELTRSQQRALAAEYRGYYDELFAQMTDPTVRSEWGEETPLGIEERDPLEIVLARAG